MCDASEGNRCSVCAICLHTTSLLSHFPRNQHPVVWSHSLSHHHRGVWARFVPAVLCHYSHVTRLRTLGVMSPKSFFLGSISFPLNGNSWPGDAVSNVVLLISDITSIWGEYFRGQCICAFLASQLCVVPWALMASLFTIEMILTSTAEVWKSSAAQRCLYSLIRLFYSFQRHQSPLWHCICIKGILRVFIYYYYTVPQICFTTFFLCKYL